MLHLTFAYGVKKRLKIVPNNKFTILPRNFDIIFEFLCTYILGYQTKCLSAPLFRDYVALKFGTSNVTFILIIAKQLTM